MSIEGFKEHLISQHYAKAQDTMNISPKEYAEGILKLSPNTLMPHDTIWHKNGEACGDISHTHEGMEAQ